MLTECFIYYFIWLCFYYELDLVVKKEKSFSSSIRCFLRNIGVKKSNKNLIFFKKIIVYKSHFVFFYIHFDHEYSVRIV